MNATTILLARHGETSLSREDYFCGSTDVPLSEAGQAQAEALARALRAVPLAAVYCSPLQRARDTAAPTASWHNLEPTVLADLREMDFGAWEGRARAEILDMDGATYERWARNQTAHTPAGSEHPYAVAGRAVPALMRIPMCYDGLGQIALGNPLQTRAVEGPNDEYQAHRPPSEPSR
ncbi:MAG: histidine phosphatase family protein, partial [Chloroflexales bacterium]|nr:histidine phosphatase family protein [Chloroflexales bacterium]